MSEFIGQYVGDPRWSSPELGRFAKLIEEGHGAPAGICSHCGGELFAGIVHGCLGYGSRSLSLVAGFNLPAVLVAESGLNELNGNWKLNGDEILTRSDLCDVDARLDSIQQSGASTLDYAARSLGVLSGKIEALREQITEGETQELAVVDGVARELAGQAGREAWRASHSASSAVELLDGYRATSRADRQALTRQVAVLWLLLAATWIPLGALVLWAWL